LAQQRQGCPNQALHGAALDLHAALDAPARQFLHKAATRLGWSARATHRAIQVARTIADLAEARAIDVAHLAEAVQYRRGPAGTTGR
jgi:magnesium chelatase family protein